jgi:hypothetical protein
MRVRPIVCEPPSPRAVPAAHLAAGSGGPRTAVVLADPAASRAAVNRADSDGLVVITGTHLPRGCWSEPELAPVARTMYML